MRIIVMIRQSFLHRTREDSARLHIERLDPPTPLPPNGSCRIIIAPTDPGVGNRMDTAGRTHGGMALRYNQVVEDIAPACEIVPLESLR